MKKIVTPRFLSCGLVLVIAAVVLILLSFVLHRSDISTAALVICGTACFVLGIFLFTLSGNEGTGKDVENLLSPQSTINVSRIIGDLGLLGRAHFLPSQGTKDTVSLFIPVGPFEGAPKEEDTTFSLSPPRGMTLVSPGNGLLQILRKKAGWSPQDDPEHLRLSLKEVIEDTFAFSPLIETNWNGVTLTITLHDFRWIGACREVRKEATPSCCMTYPCPVCALIAGMASECLRKPCTFDLMDVRSRDLTLGIRVVDEKTADRSVEK